MKIISHYLGHCRKNCVPWFCTRCVSAYVWAYRQTSASICTHNFLTANEVTRDQQWILSPAYINKRNNVFILSDPKYINISYTEQ